VSLVDVARKDLTNLSRSRALWAMAAVVTLLVATYAYLNEGYRQPPSEVVGRLFATLVLVVAVVLPLVALVVSYRAVSGEREGGGLALLLGLPNTRRDVYLGKLGSRLLLVAAGLALAFAATASVVRARHGVLPVGTVFGLYAVSLAYAAVFVGLAVALSATIATRGRAIAAGVGAYLVLVMLFAVPVVRVSAIVRWVDEGLLGLAPHPYLYDAVSYASPYTAVRKAANLVLPAAQRATVFPRPPGGAGHLPLYLGDWFSLVVFAVWLVVPLALGLWRFQRIDLE